jgi:hypothetical protein
MTSCKYTPKKAVYICVAVSGVERVRNYPTTNKTGTNTRFLTCPTSTLNKETVCFSETLVPREKNARCHKGSSRQLTELPRHDSIVFLLHLSACATADFASLCNCRAAYCGGKQKSN